MANKIKGTTIRPLRAWLILFTIIGTVSLATAVATVLVMRLQGGATMGGNDPLSVAEREGTFAKIKAELKWPNLNFGIEGNALVIEGTADSEDRIHEVLTFVKKMIKADAFYFVHPYIERPDWITGRVQAVREGDYDYRRKDRSVFVVDLMKTAAKVAKADPLAEAEKIVSRLAPIDLSDAESLYVKPIPKPE